MKRLIAISICIMAAVSCLAAASTVTVDAGHPARKVSPLFYGLMTEEINHSYDGGLYAELIQNRAFLDDANAPVHWSVVNDDGSAATLALDSSNSFNDKLTMSLRLSVTKDRKSTRLNSSHLGI